MNTIAAASSATASIFSLARVTRERQGAVILRDVSLELPRTAITALIGPSGAGKTSLLRLLNRLDDPTSGHVSFDGKPVQEYSLGVLRRRVGFVFQTPVMFPGTVIDNLSIAHALGQGVAGHNADTLDTHAILASVGLHEDYGPRDAARLSGGEQQRVSIARALMTRPEVLLLDEPTSALDPEVAEHLLATIHGLTSEHGIGVVMVTHRLAEARSVSTHTVMMEAGHVVEAGPTNQLFTAATTDRARAYLATAD